MTSKVKVRSASANATCLECYIKHVNALELGFPVDSIH